MIVAIRALGAIWVRALLESIRAHRESDTNDRVAGFEDVRTPILRRGGCQPRLYTVIDEGIIRPLSDLVAEAMNILKCPYSATIRSCVNTGCYVGSPRESLDDSITVAIRRATATTSSTSAVVSENAAVEYILAYKQKDVIG